MRLYLFVGRGKWLIVKDFPDFTKHADLWDYSIKRGGETQVREIAYDITH